MGRRGGEETGGVAVGAEGGVEGVAGVFVGELGGVSFVGWESSQMRREEEEEERKRSRTMEETFEGKEGKKERKKERKKATHSFVMAISRHLYSFVSIPNLTCHDYVRPRAIVPSTT